MNKSKGEQKIKLLADATLGRLAKWLRILGYDTAYLPDGDHYAVMRLARAEGRLILTRGQALAQQTSVHALLIQSGTLEDQLRQVYVAVGPPQDPALPRCPVCNNSLVEAEPEQVTSHAPPYVQRTQVRFSWCTLCERLYWPGTHWQRMEAVVDRVRDDSL